MQRHHLLPRALLGRRAFTQMFLAVESERQRFDDFRENGLLLPCDESAALRLGLPLHRGPHHCYTELVLERVSQIEAGWRHANARDAQTAVVEAQMRLDLLRRGLRRLLLTRRTTRPLLNRYDPHGRALDFSDLDAVVDMLWDGTAGVAVAVPAAMLQSMPESMPERARSSALAD